jgi:hypothetical protein
MDLHFGGRLQVAIPDLSQGAGFMVWISGLGVSGFRAQGAGFRVQGVWFEDQGVGCRVLKCVRNQSLGFRVLECIRDQGVGFRAVE